MNFNYLLVAPFLILEQNFTINPINAMEKKDSERLPSGMRYSGWCYVLRADDHVLGAFVSASTAYGHWLAYAEKYNTPDSPLCTCVRYRVRLNPYDMQSQDVTMNFMRAWESLHQSQTFKNSEK